MPMVSRTRWTLLVVGDLDGVGVFHHVLRRTFLPTLLSLSPRFVPNFPVDTDTKSPFS
jgi:hypothetical protein